MMKHTLKPILLTCIATLMVGCKLAVIVVEGGEVQSTGSGTCVAGTICIVDVDDPYFSEIFTAIPDEGMYFVKWNSGDRFLCGTTNPECNLSFEGHEETEAVQKMVDSAEMFYLMPIFKLVKGVSINDMVFADGKEWAQVDLFTNLSWNDINAVCPADSGICSGVLNGYDMTGWAWASVDDVNALFNYYIGFDALGPGPDQYDEPSPPADSVSVFFNDWRTTGANVWLMAVLRDLSRTHRDGQRAYMAAVIPSYCDQCTEPDDDYFAIMTTDSWSWIIANVDTTGAWFYRIP